MGSSELTPSDHSSVYDAEALQDEGSIASGCALEDRSGGTRLCIIKEQQSIQTINTLPSVSTFQRRISPLRPQTHENDVSKQDAQRRRYFSADEIVRRVAGSSVDLPDSPKPARPTCEPPLRRSTPPGFARWPNDARNADDVSDCVQQSLMSSLFQRMQHRGPARTPAYVPSVRQRLNASHSNNTNVNASRLWRPVVSAHSTHRFSELSSHPFASAQDADVFAKSRQALRYASENNVPVTPARAATRASQRSAVLPAPIRARCNLVRPPIHAEVAQSGSQDFFRYPARYSSRLCKHQLAKLRNGHKITSPQLVAHYGYTSSSFDGTSLEPAVHELPPIATHDYARQSISSNGPRSPSLTAVDPHLQTSTHPVINNASTFSSMISDTNTPPEARA